MRTKITFFRIKNILHYAYNIPPYRDWRCKGWRNCKCPVSEVKGTLVIRAKGYNPKDFIATTKCFGFIDTHIDKQNTCIMPLGLIITPGLHEFNPLATPDHHRLSILYNPIGLLQKTIYSNDGSITEYLIFITLNG